jgi:hypothetical protein
MVNVLASAETLNNLENVLNNLKMLMNYCEDSDLNAQIISQWGQCAMTLFCNHNQNLFLEI